MQYITTSELLAAMAIVLTVLNIIVKILIEYIKKD